MITAYSTSLHAMWCRVPEFDLGGELWPGIGVDYVWRGTVANSPAQGTALCWRTWKIVKDGVGGFAGLVGTPCEISVEDDTGEIDYWAYGAWDPNGAFRSATVGDLTPVEPKRSWTSRVVQWARWALGNQTQETARCEDI